MRVRAIRDGVYAGYYRVGAWVSDEGKFDGEVFDIDDKPFPFLDIEGKPVIEVDAKGRQIYDKDGKPKIKMNTWFSPEWMEQVSEDTPLTAELDPRFDYPPFQIPIQYRERKKLGGQIAANKENKSLSTAVI